MARCLIGLGANLGDPSLALRGALDRLRADPRIAHVEASRFYATAPAGGPAGQPSFVNAVALLETDLEPEALLDLLQQVEASHGRERGIRWDARTLDLDLLLYDDRTIETPRLTVPHPRMAFRRFVLEGGAEVAPDWIHPTTCRTLRQLLDHVNTAPRYVALASACWFAKQYVARSACLLLHERGIACHLSQTRGMTVVGAPPIEDPEHSFVEHYVELVPRLAADLREGLSQQPPSWLVASFWPGEVELGARLWFTGEARAVCEKAAREAFNALPSPALLVLLETPDDLLLFRPGEPGHDDAWYAQASRLAAQRDELEHHVRQLQGVPVLRLSSARPEEAIREVAAAVEAMQPMTV